MNTFLIFLLIVITLVDCVVKYKVMNNGGDLNILIEIAVEKMGWFGYFTIIIILLGIISLIDSIVLNFVLIAAMTFILMDHVRVLKQSRIR